MGEYLYGAVAGIRSAPVTRKSASAGYRRRPDMGEASYIRFTAELPALEAGRESIVPERDDSRQHHRDGGRTGEKWRSSRGRTRQPRVSCDFAMKSCTYIRNPGSMNDLWYHSHVFRAGVTCLFADFSRACANESDSFSERIGPKNVAVKQNENWLLSGHISRVYGVGHDALGRNMPIFPPWGRSSTTNAAW